MVWIKEKQKEWYHKNIDRLRIKNKEYRKKKYHEDKDYKQRLLDNVKRCKLNHKERYKKKEQKYFQKYNNKEDFRYKRKLINLHLKCGISKEECDKLIKSGCVICGINDFYQVEIHGNNGSHKKEDLYPLCSNHHFLHHRKHLNLEQLLEYYIN